MFGTTSVQGNRLLVLLTLPCLIIVSNISGQNKIGSPIIGTLSVDQSSIGNCNGTVSETHWCFWQWGHSGCNQNSSPKTHCVHTNGTGFGLRFNGVRAIDNYSWDANLIATSDLDANMPVYSILGGTVVKVDDDFGEVILKHEFPDGTIRYSSYMHMTDLSFTTNDVVKDTLIRAGTLLGNIGKEGTTNNHLHFTWYELDEDTLKSIDISILENSIIPHFGEVIKAPNSTDLTRIYFEIPGHLRENEEIIGSINIQDLEITDPRDGLVIHRTTNSIIANQDVLGRFYFDVSLQANVNTPSTQQEYFDIQFVIPKTSELLYELNAYGHQQVQYIDCDENIDQEPNTGISLAVPLSLKPLGILGASGGIIRGNLNTQNDKDRYSFTTEVEGTAAFIIDSDQGSVDFDFYYSDTKIVSGDNDGSLIQNAEIGCVKKGTYYLLLQDKSQNASCLDYSIRFIWAPEIKVCRTFNNSLKSNSCSNCPAIDVRNLNVYSPFGTGDTYNIETHLIGFDEDQYYNVYAVDADGLVGTTQGNIRAVSSTSGPSNIKLTNIPCGKQIVFRVEHVDNPDDCFYEEVVNIPSCGSDNKQLAMSWPGLSGQCLTAGENVTISWSSANIDRVNIYRCRVDGECSTLAYNINNTGSFSWTIPSFDGEFFVKVEDTNDELICDSGSYFEIDDDCNRGECEPPSVTLLSPANQSAFKPGYDLYLNFEKSVITNSCQFREYELQFSTSSTFPNSSATTSYIATSGSIGPLPLTTERRYYWRARSLNVNGDASNWSSSNYFDIDDSATVYTFNDPRSCYDSDLNSDNICSTNRSTFNTNELIYASCSLTDLQEEMSVLMKWKRSGQTVYEQESSSKSTGTLNAHSSYVPSLSGSYVVEFYRKTSTGETLLGNKSFTVSTPPITNTFGDLELVNVSSEDEVNTELIVAQGSSFRLDFETEFDGNLSPFTNKELEVDVGVFLKRLRSSNLSSGWNKFLGIEPVDFRCPSSTSICDKVWTDNSSGSFRIPYDVEPGDYYILAYIDHVDQYDETNEGDNHDFLQITITPFCDDIFPIYDENEMTTSVNLSWEENLNVNTTNVRFRINGTTTWTVVQDFRNGDKLNGLDPCTSYEQQVQGICDGADSEWSRSNYFSTACEVPCVPPSGRYEYANYTTAEVFWGELESVYLYEVRFRKVGDSNWILEGLDDCCYEYIGSLEQGVEYEWQIRTVCGNENSTWSSSRNFKTKSLCNDGIQNGLETGVDCGGECTPCDCEQDYHILDYTAEDNLHIQVRKQIQVSDEVANQSTILKAGESIQIEPGTEVEPGTKFEAIIDVCDQEISFNEKPTGIYLTNTMIGYSYHIMPVEMNNDGHMDIVFRYHPSYGSNTQILVYLGNGDGTFNAPLSYTGSYSHSSLRDFADLNNDGFNDIVITCNYPSSARIYLNDGNGGLQSVDTYTLTNFSNGVEVADMDGDGDLDLIGLSGNASISQNTISLLRNNGDGLFSSQETTNTSGFGRFLAPGDIDGDGDLDLIYGAGSPSYGGPREIRTYLNNGSGQFSLYHTSDNSNLYTIYPNLYDFNNDGILDLPVLSNDFTGIKYGPEDFKYDFSNLYTIEDSTYRFLNFDIDLDNNIDFFVQKESTIDLLINNGSGAFTTNVQAISIDRLQNRNQIVDMDRDGDLDVVYLRGNYIYIAENQLR